MTDGRYLTFTICGKVCVILLDRIVHIHSMIAIEHLPGLDKAIIGTYRYSDMIVYGVDFSQYFSSSEHLYQTGAKIVIVSNGGCYFGILVDTVGEIIDPHNDGVMKGLQNPAALQFDFISDVLVLEEQIIYVLDPLLILAKKSDKI